MAAGVGVSAQGLSAQRVSPGGVFPGGCVLIAAHTGQGGVYPGGVWPRGVCWGMSAQRVCIPACTGRWSVYLGGVWPGGVCLGGVCPGVSAWGVCVSQHALGKGVSVPVHAGMQILLHNKCDWYPGSTPEQRKISSKNTFSGMRSFGISDFSNTVSEKPTPPTLGPVYPTTKCAPTITTNLHHSARSLATTAHVFPAQILLKSHNQRESLHFKSLILNYTAVSHLA